jgi:hypothetical protein
MCNRAVKARRTARSTGYAYDDARHFGARIGVCYPGGVPEVSPGVCRILKSVLPLRGEALARFKPGLLGPGTSNERG